MYQNIFVENRWDDEPTVHLWDDEVGYQEIEFPNYCFVRNEGGDYQTLHGDPAMKMAKADLTWKRKEEIEDTYGEDAIHESDVPIETRVLLDLYAGKEEPSTGHRKLFYDIEVSTEGGYPDVSKADKAITSVAMWDTVSEQMRVLLLDEDVPSTENVEVQVFKNEIELLEAVVDLWRDVDPTILVTYNGDRFDNPYLYRRLNRVLGDGAGDQLSSIEKVKYNDHSGLYRFAGVSSFDYLKIYRNFKFSELSSYSLDNVAKTELDRGKVEYVGEEVNGEVIEDLDDLKRLAPEKFVEYNAVDVELMIELDEKLGFIEMARFISHLGHVPYEDVYKSSRFIEGAILDHLHGQNVVAPNKSSNTRGYKVKGDHEAYSKRIKTNKEIHNDVPRKGTIGIQKTKTKKEEFRYEAVEGDTFILKQGVDFYVPDGAEIGMQFEGAYVKEPSPGLYEWVFDLDLTSQYPCAIMSLNISPETKVAKAYEPDWYPKLLVEDQNLGPVKTWVFETNSWRTFDTVGDFKAWLLDNEYSIAANGTVYDNSEEGVIPSVIRGWFENRQAYKAKRDEAEEAGNSELAEYYDSQQHNRKILINSVYGVLGLPIFRFYDLDNAEATTLTGQSTIKFTQEMGDRYYSKYGDQSQDDRVLSCLYTDTDSVFYSAKPLVDTEDLESEEEIVEETIAAATRVQAYLNRSYDFYAKELLMIPGDHMFDIKQELVASRGLWVRKKRYALWIVNDEGHPTSELDVVGMDIIRSDFPEAFNDVLENVIITILKESNKEKAAEYVLDFQDSLESEPLERIARPTGVSGVEKWRADDYKSRMFKNRAPIHSKAAIVYNELLKTFGVDRDYEPIKGGDKMRWVYLHKNPYGFNQAGFKDAGNAGQVMEFLEEYVDRRKMYKTSLDSKLRDVYNAIGWQFPSVARKNAEQFFDFY